MILHFWIWLGKKLGFNFVDMYAPDEDVIAITFSKDEEYIDKVGEIE